MNAIIGSLFAGQKVFFRWEPFHVNCKNNIIKTHDSNKMERIQKWVDMNTNRNITFISSSRKSKINQTVTVMRKNHIVFDYKKIISSNFCVLLNKKIYGSVAG